MIKKIYLTLLIIFTSFFILVNGSVNAQNTERLPFINIYDVKSFTMNNSDYIAILNNEDITILNYSGEVINNINYENEKLHFAYNNEASVNINDVHLEIQTINGKNYFVIIVENSTSETINSVEVLDYEENKSLWQYRPYMQTNDKCGVLKSCSEVVPISHYEIKDNLLYISAGHLLQKMNLTTGELIKTNQFSNNIWSFTFIDDINRNDTEDIALAVQPSKVVMIDGINFGKINDLKVAKNIRTTVPDTNGQTKDRVVELNVWDVIYIKERKTLVAAAEDGFVYEINPKTNTITKSTMFVDIGNINVTEFYYHYSNQNMSYKNPYNYKMISLRKLNSIDNDEIEDYMVVYNKLANQISNQDLAYHYSLVTSTREEPKRMISEFVYTDGTYVIEKDESSRSRTHYLYRDLNTNMILYSEEVTKGAFKRIFSFGEYILAFERISKITLYHRQSEVFSIPTLRGENFEIVDDKLVVFDDISYPQQIKVFNEENEKLVDFYDEDLYLQKYYFLENQLYVFYNELSEVGKVVRVFDLDTGEITVNQPITLCQTSKCDLYSYDDVNNDGVSEVLIKKYPPTSHNEMYIYVYDVVKNEILETYYLENLYYQRHIIQAVNDIDGDNIKDIIFLDFGNRYNAVNIYRIGSKEKQAEYLPTFTTYIKTRWVFAPIFLEVNQLVDLNTDGIEEIILENTNEFYMIDVINGETYNLSSHYRNQPKSSIQTIEDLNQDGKPDIVMLNEYRNSNLYLEIMEYNNTSMNSYYVEDIGNFDIDHVNVSVYDYNNDQIKDVVAIGADKNNNINLLVFDPEVDEPVLIPVKHNKNSVSHNVDLESLNMGKVYDVKTINGKDYFITSIVLNDSPEKFFYIDASDYTIKYIFDEYNGFVGSKYVTYNSINKLVLSDLYDYSKIEITKTGLFKNIINMNFNDAFDDIGLIEIEIKDEIYKTNSGNIDFHLKPGKYHVYFTVHTMDGEKYNYYDIIEVNKMPIEIPVSVVIVVGTVGLYMVTKKKIQKKFYQV